MTEFEAKHLADTRELASKLADTLANHPFMDYKMAWTWDELWVFISRLRELAGRSKVEVASSDTGRMGYKAVGEPEPAIITALSGGTKLKPGMMLVYTCANRGFSNEHKAAIVKILREQASKALNYKPDKLPIGILILDQGDKLEVLPGKPNGELLHWMEDAAEKMYDHFPKSVGPEMQEHIEKYHDKVLCIICKTHYPEQEMCGGLAENVCKSCFVKMLKGKTNEARTDT